MQRASSIVPVFVASLLSTAALADDPDAARNGDNPHAVIDSSPALVRSVPGYWPKRQRSQLIEPLAYSSESTASLASLDFQDAGTFARVSKLRELSLLTLAEVGRTRLFFGVSEKGLFGLHLGALPGIGDERCLELARLPYLKDSKYEVVAR